MSEKRHFQRVFYNSDATLSNENTTVSCKILDLSLKGCLLEFDQTWQADPNHLYTLKLDLSDDIAIIMELSVTHVIDKKVGFKCEHIDIDSISQLRRLVELNLGNTEMLERDLAALSDWHN
jgi:hypothetical protein